jgi:hypothetical protein
VMGKMVTAERVTVCWGVRPYSLWLDEYRWPVKVEEGGGTAVESRYIRYQVDNRALPKVSGEVV